MFDQVAARYDLTNDVLAFGQTRAWRKATVRALEPNPGDRILDLAAGTGSSTVPFEQAGAFRAILVSGCWRRVAADFLSCRSQRAMHCTCRSLTTPSTPSRFHLACATSLIPRLPCARCAA